ncbi:MAG: amidohydrolase [Proteobacteria bacterium]|nr:amidohydrolase [Pseudomonadota bacterium]
MTDLKAEFAEYRRELHKNPQTKYEETFAAGLIAKKLKEWGIPFEQGIAVTGIVATIKGKKSDSGKFIGLRADMDALDIIERSGVPHTSRNHGKMHACGHDGHTAGLLAAAKHLSITRNFNGTAHLIFQPAEEGGNGAHKMIEEGLFERFPCDYVFGAHNWPFAPLGKAGTRVGGLLASVDKFDIVVTGKGGHAAMPHQVIDPAVVAAHIITALQSIVSRNIAPVDSAVVSVTNLNVGTGAFNIVSNEAKMSGTVRTFSNETRHFIKKRMEEIIVNVAAAYGAKAKMEYEFTNDPTVNTADGVEMAVKALTEILGTENVDGNCEPTMGGEDFGAFLAKRPGAFVFLGQSVSGNEKSPHSHGLHSPFYDFNDDVIPIAASFFTKLVENYMPLKK